MDDEEGVRAMLVELCAHRGLACRGFADGDEFLQALDGLEPGCVLLDMRLPRLNGLQVQAEMVKRGRALPVVAITGHADADMAVASMKMGAVDFLEKPFLGEVLFEAVDRAFAKVEQMEGSAKPNGTTAPREG
nr:response regulator [uncultured Sphingosinicella sp.]